MNGLTRFPVHLAQISPGGSYELPGGAHLQHLVQISPEPNFEELRRLDLTVHLV